MRCARCDDRFEPREETIMHEKDDVLRRFHPECFIEFEEKNPGGEAKWSGGPPYEDLVMLSFEDLEKVVSENTFNLERMLELEEKNRDREKVKKLLENQIEDRDKLLDKVEQLEENN